MPEPKDHSYQRGAIESVLRRIPGLHGYLEKEYRRESDQLQRDWLAGRLERAKRGLDSATRALADAAQIDVLPQCERLRGRVDKLIGRIRGAMHGYSGFFDLVQIDARTLDRVYEYDISLMDSAEQLAEGVERLTTEPAEVPAAVGDLIARCDEFERLWDVRDDILKGLK